MLPTYTSFWDNIKKNYDLVKAIIPFKHDKLRRQVENELNLFKTHFSDFNNINDIILNNLKSIEDIKKFIIFIKESHKLIPKRLIEGKIVVDSKFINSKLYMNEKGYISNLYDLIFLKKTKFFDKIEILYSKDIQKIIEEFGNWNIKWDVEFTKKHVLSREDIISIANIIKSEVGKLKNIISNQNKFVKDLMEIYVSLEEEYELGYNFQETGKIKINILNQLLVELDVEKKSLNQLIGINNQINSKIVPLKGEMDRLYQEFENIKKISEDILKEYEDIKKILPTINVIPNESNNMFYSCGYPKNDNYYLTLIENAEKLRVKIESIISKIKDNNLNQKIEKLNEILKFFSEAIENIKFFCEKTGIIDKSIKNFAILSSNPLTNKNQLFVEYTHIKEAIMQIQKVLKITSFNFLIFNKMKPLSPNINTPIYHGIGINTGEQVTGITQKKTPKEYAVSILSRMSKRIYPTKSEKNYYCCPKLPAVFFYKEIGKWSAYCYFKLSTKDYPVFNCGSYFGPDEIAIYSQSYLPLKNFDIVFHSKISKDLRGMVEINEIIKELYNLGALEIKFTIYGQEREWTVLEYYNQVLNVEKGA